MRNQHEQDVLFGNGDEPLSNTSSNAHINDLIEAGLSRRQVVAGGAALGVMGFLGVALPGNAEAADNPLKDLLERLKKRGKRLPFNPVAVTRADTISVPAGYKATPFIPWGTPIRGSFPAFLDNAGNSAADQADQIGMHHDGMHFFPIDSQHGTGHRSDHGLLVLNHEYIDAPLLHHNGPTLANGKRSSAEEVRKEIHAHGVSVVEVRRVRGQWEVLPSARSRTAKYALQP